MPKSTSKSASLKSTKNTARKGSETKKKDEGEHPPVAPSKEKRSSKTTSVAPPSPAPSKKAASAKPASTKAAPAKGATANGASQQASAAGTTAAKGAKGATPIRVIDQPDVQEKLRELIRLAKEQ